LLRGAIMAKPAKPARPAYAVCPRIERIVSTRIPQLFPTESAGKRFLKSEISPGLPEAEARATGLTIEQVRARRAERKAQLQKDRKAVAEKMKRGELRPSDYPHHLRPIRNEDQGWQGPVPVIRITDYRGPGCNRTLRDFLPAEAVGSMPALKTDEEIDRVLEGRSADYSCYLNADSRFDELEADAWRRVGHEYSGRCYRNIGEIIVRAIHDVEAAFQKFHTDVTCAAVAAFWRSWQVRRHIAEFCSRLAKSDTARVLAGNPFDAAEEAERARVHLCRQLAAFAHEVLDEAIPSSAADTKPEVIAARPEKVSPPESAAAPPAASAPPLAEPAEIPAPAPAPATSPTVEISTLGHQEARPAHAEPAAPHVPPAAPTAPVSEQPAETPNPAIAPESANVGAAVDASALRGEVPSVRRRGRPKGIPVNGEFLRQRRMEYRIEDSKGLRERCSQEEFAQKLGVATSTYQEMEKGNRISEALLRQVAADLHVLFNRTITIDELTAPEYHSRLHNTRENPEKPGK
jgi:transcriptional regulator with XRE-family HTH domain